MKFSIIVPVYNTSEYLSACVDSVLSQDCQDWELILVDDGSTDNSGEIVDEYAKRDNRIKVIHKKNQGQLFARMDGFFAAEGDWLICLDSDDFWETNCLSVLEHYFKTQVPDLVLFPCRLYGHDDDGLVGEYADRVTLVDKKDLYERVITSNLLNSMVLKVFRRELIKDDTTDYEPFRQRSYGEDKVQTLNIITRAEKVLYIPDALYNYRYNPTSVSNDKEFTKAPAMVANKMYDVLFAYMKKWDMYDDVNIKKCITYYLHNFLLIVYRFRKTCVSGEEKKAFRRYRWRDLLSSEAKKMLINNNLSVKEKFKLFLVVYLPWLL